MARLAVGNHAMVLGACLRKLMGALYRTEWRAVERRALERLVWLPIVAGNEILMPGRRMRGGVLPLKGDVAVPEFSQVPTRGRLGIEGGKQGVATAGDLAIDRALEGRTACAIGEPLEGFARALGLILCAATVLVFTSLAQQGT